MPAVSFTTTAHYVHSPHYGFAFCRTRLPAACCMVTHAFSGRFEQAVPPPPLHRTCTRIYHLRTTAPPATIRRLSTLPFVVYHIRSFVPFFYSSFLHYHYRAFSTPAFTFPDSYRSTADRYALPFSDFLRTLHNGSASCCSAVFRCTTATA